jgi:TatD DNase family protein
MTLFVDTHCHLDLYPDPPKTLDEAGETIVVAATELPSRYRMLAARLRGDRRVRVALGLHPLRAESASALELGQLVRQLENVEYVGEVGLDFSAHGKETRTAQLRVFDRLLEQPALRHKVVTVHSRGAEAAVVERLRSAGVVAILHWYTGPLGLLPDALAAGLYFSINPAMLRSGKGRKVIAAIPRDRALTESDGPFAKVRGRAAGPGDMRWLTSELARLWGASPEEARQQVYDNLSQLYTATVGTSVKKPGRHGLRGSRS